MEKQQNVANATDSSDASSQGSKTSPEHAATSDGDATKTFTEQYDQVIENIEDAGEDKQND